MKERKGKASTAMVCLCVDQKEVLSSHGEVFLSLGGRAYLRCLLSADHKSSTWRCSQIRYIWGCLFSIKTTCDFFVFLLSILPVKSVFPTAHDKPNYSTNTTAKPCTTEATVAQSKEQN